MIPLPPADRALPALARALDSNSMMELLNEHLCKATDGRFNVVACRPCYTRYKRGTNCLVQYDLTLFDSATGKSDRTSAYAKLYSGGDAAQQWSRRSMGRLIERAAYHHPEPSFSRGAYVPEVGAVVQFYPVDIELRALIDAASHRRMQDAFAGPLPPEIMEGMEGCEAVLIRYKAGRKALFRYRLRGAEVVCVYGKLHVDDRGAGLVDLERTLVRAGVSTPQPLAYLPDLRMLVHPEVLGDPLSALPRASERERWMEPIAHLLASLHDAPCAVLPSYSAGNEIQTLQAAARAISIVAPSLGRRAERLARALGMHIADLWGSESTTHGDFYDDQVLVSERGGVALIDLDEARRADPLTDIGNFLAHLTSNLSDAEALRAKFLDAYAECRPYSRAAVPIFEAGALLKLAISPFRRLEPDWPAGVERIVRLAEVRLDEAAQRRSPAALAACVPMLEEVGSGNGVPRAVANPDDIPPDPGLPQLETLLDPARVGAELERAVYFHRVRVTGVEVVRYKPTRRCVLRYDIQVSGPGGERRERLYAKTFANRRAQRVHLTTSAIAAAVACGGDVRLPTPVGYIERLQLLLQRELPGRPLAEVLFDGGEQIVSRIADAIYTLHSSGPELPRRHYLRDEVDPLVERVDRLSQTLPHLSGPAQRCLRLAQDGVEPDVEWRWRPVHRDFYHEQILVNGQGLSILDFDDAKMSDPVVDVANFVAHLRLLGLQRKGDADAFIEQQATFEQRYRQLDPEIDPELVAFLEGVTLLRLAEIHHGRKRGEWLAGHLLRESERLLYVGRR